MHPDEGQQVSTRVTFHIRLLSRQHDLTGDTFLFEQTGNNKAIAAIIAFPGND
jgi:hypothetical protein